MGGPIVVISIHLNKLAPNTQAAHPYSRTTHAWRTVTESLRLASGLVAAMRNSRRHGRRKRRTTSQWNVGGAHILGDGRPPLVLLRRQRRTTSQWNVGGAQILGNGGPPLVLPRRQRRRSRSRLIKATLVDVKAAAMVSLSVGIKLVSHQPWTGQTVDQTGQFLVHFEVRGAGLANCRWKNNVAGCSAGGRDELRREKQSVIFRGPWRRWVVTNFATARAAANAVSAVSFPKSENILHLRQFTLVNKYFYKVFYKCNSYLKLLLRMMRGERGTRVLFPDLTTWGSSTAPTGS